MTKEQAMNLASIFPARTRAVAITIRTISATIAASVLALAVAGAA
jgi:hypothetical protein